MRLFVAVEIGETVAAAAVALTNELRRRAKRLAPFARITWIAGDRLHLTVRFIGNADAENARAILLALEAPVDVEPFDLGIAGAGAFPPHGPPRVLWAGLTAGREALQLVERDVTRRLEGVGVPPEARAYSPHLTLARVREAAGLASRTLLDGLGDTMVGTTRVDAITLFESRLSPQGSTYVPLQRTSLREI